MHSSSVLYKYDHNKEINNLYLRDQTTGATAGDLHISNSYHSHKFNNVL